MVRSLYSGVSGLTTHQTRMDVIGNNIANVNTIGFKASRTVFKDIFYQTAINETGGGPAVAGNNPSEVGYGVQLSSIDKDMSQSNFLNTNKGLDCAIDGDGFFVTCTFNGSMVTRDSNGLLDWAPRMMDGDSVDVSKLPSYTINYGGDSADLAGFADSLNYNPDTSTIIVTPSTAYGLKPSTTNYTRLGTMEIDSIGNLVLGNQFVIGTCNNSEGLNAIGDASKAALNELQIHSSGNADPGAAYEHSLLDAGMDEVTASDITAANIININELINKAWNCKSYTPAVAGDFTDPQNPVAGTPAKYEFGSPLLTVKDLTTLKIENNGMISATYNGEIKYLARIEIAVFDNPDGLAEDGGTTFAETSASGKAGIKRPMVDAGVEKTKVCSGKLEMSNVNLANEFSDMIVTQRGYQANARIITTSDSMLEELVNLKR